jgi:hypothetical protein
MTTPYNGRPMPPDFHTIALNNGVAALQIYYKASYNAVVRWLGELPEALQEARRIYVPLGRAGGQPAIVRDDTMSINASDRIARQSAESGTQALEAKYTEAAKRNGWRVWEYRA